MCVGGPADGELVEDIGPYLRMHKLNAERGVLSASPFELVVYVKIAFKRQDGGVLYVYEAEGTDAMMEMWEFYLKRKKADAVPRR